MSLLSDADKGKYALAHGRIFEHSCDEPGCGRLIPYGETCIVLKWQKRTDGLQALLGCIAVKVRCMVCERDRRPPPVEVKVAGAGRGAKKVSAEVAAGIKIDERLRRFVIKLLKDTPEGIPVASFLARLRKKKMVRDMKNKDVVATLKGMKKLKMFRRKGGMVVLPKEKKIKKGKKEKVLK